MSLHGVYYEFPVNRDTVAGLVERMGLTQANLPEGVDVVDNLMDILDTTPSIFTKVEVKDKPGLMLRLSKRHEAERLPHPIEGAYAFIHASSEGQLSLEELRTEFQCALSSLGVSYQRYE